MLGNTQTRKISNNTIFASSIFLKIGPMCSELHGKILENEPENIATIPGIPNFGQ